MKPSGITVLAHSSSSNSLGRAISMAMVAREISDTRLVACNDGPVWAPCAQFDVDVEVIEPNHWHAVVDRSGTGEDNQLLWVCKGIDPTGTLVRMSKHLRPDTTVVLDLDDHDVALANEFRAYSLLNRGRLNRFRRMHPTRIARGQASIADQAFGLTYSSKALRGLLHTPERVARSAIIPHVRKPEPTTIKTSLPCSRPIRIGVFGTIRPHKGGNHIRRLIAAEPDFQVVSFVGSGLRIDEADRGRWQEIPTTTPLSEAYGLVDVALVPIERSSIAASVQLPAKIVDAMKYGVPVVATDTPAISEYLADNSILITGDLSNTEHLAKLVRDANQPIWRDRAKRAYDEQFTPQAAARSLARLLDEGEQAEECGS